MPSREDRRIHSYMFQLHIPHQRDLITRFDLDVVVKGTRCRKSMADIAKSACTTCAMFGTSIPRAAASVATTTVPASLRQN